MRTRHRSALRLLIVEEEPFHARLLRSNLEQPGRVSVRVVESGEEALSELARGAVDAVLADPFTRGSPGLELVRRLRAADPSLPILLMSAQASSDRVVAGIRAGGTDFIDKPVNVTAALAIIERAVANRQQPDEVTARAERRATSAEILIGGDHPRLKSVRGFAERVASVPESRVLLVGESGTGKSRLARMIHELSGAPGRFVEVNCGALPANLIESELFGHEKGAFTDAKTMKRGLVEQADRGTLFLDEIGTLPLDLQSKLLLFLENREFRRLGGERAIASRARIVTATNEDLQGKVRQRAFRQDLLYRLDVARIEMPPLRDMPEVIPQLAERFVRELCEQFGRSRPQLTDRSFARLVDYPWPGNVRELRNAVERALIFHSGGAFEVVPPKSSPADSPASGATLTLELGLSLEEVERRYLAAMLETSHAELHQIAEQLGMSRKAFWEKRKRYGLTR